MKILITAKWIWLSFMIFSFQSFSQSRTTSAANRLSKAIQIKTVSYSDSSLIEYNYYQEFIDFLKQNYPLTHQHLQPRVINDYSLLFTWQGKNKDLLPVLYMGHYDVVPVDSASLDKWQEEPFSGKITNGYVWGRGAVDDKFVVISLMETCERLLHEKFVPQRTIYLAFGADEEIGGRNGALQIKYFLQKQKISFEMVVDEGSGIGKNMLPNLDEPVAFIAIAEKGDMNVVLTVEEKGGHSAAPDDDNAIEILSNAITRLREYPMPLRMTRSTSQMLKTMSYHLHGVLKFALKHQGLFKKMILKKMAKNNVTNALVRTVITPTIIRGGTKENVLPNYVMVNLNIRILPGDNIETVLEHIRKTVNDERIKIELTIPGNNPTTTSSTSSTAYLKLKKTIEEKFTGVIVSPVLCIGTTDSRYYSDVCQNVFRFVPLTMDAETSAMIHGNNERISLENLDKAIGFYYSLMKKMAE